MSNRKETSAEVKTGLVDSVESLDARLKELRKAL